MADFELAVAKTIKNEGGDKYTDRENDRGGPTKYGISLKLYTHILFMKTSIYNDPLTEEQVKNKLKLIDIKEAKFIYKKYFWDPNRYGEIEDQAIAEKVFDMAVLMEAPRANMIFQKQLDDGTELEFDGIIGCKTLYMINDHHCKQRQTEILQWIIDDYIKHFISICNKDKTQSHFLLDNLNRVMS